MKEYSSVILHLNEWNEVIDQMESVDKKGELKHHENFIRQAIKKITASVNGDRESSSMRPDGRLEIYSTIKAWNRIGAILRRSGVDSDAVLIMECENW